MLFANLHIQFCSSFITKLPVKCFCKPLNCFCLWLCHFLADFKGLDLLHTASALVVQLSIAVAHGKMVKSVIESNNLEIYVKEPTRITSTSEILDQFISNMEDRVKNISMSN